MIRKESGWYPPGAEFDPNAPWNQKEPEEIDVNVNIHTTLSKNVDLITLDSREVIEDDCDEDEFGRCHTKKIRYRDFSGCDFLEDYKKSEFTIMNLLDILREYVEDDLAKEDKGGKKEYMLRDILSSISGWSEDEIKVEKN